MKTFQEQSPSIFINFVHQILNPFLNFVFCCILGSQVERGGKPKGLAPRTVPEKGVRDEAPREIESTRLGLQFPEGLPRKILQMIRIAGLSLILRLGHDCMISCSNFVLPCSGQCPIVCVCFLVNI